MSPLSDQSASVCPICGGLLTPRGYCPKCDRYDEGQRAVRPAFDESPVCAECGDRGSGSTFGGCPSCGRIRPAFDEEPVSESGAHSLGDKRILDRPAFDEDRGGLASDPEIAGGSYGNVTGKPAFDEEPGRPCPVCDGHGDKWTDFSETPVRCANCNGTGRLASDEQRDGEPSSRTLPFGGDGQDYPTEPASDEKGGEP